MYDKKKKNDINLLKQMKNNIFTSIIPVCEFIKINEKDKIGFGKTSSVYKKKYKNKEITIKKILIENNLFHIQQDKNILCTDRALNDLIISYYASLVFNNSINIQKTYGYTIKNQYLYIYKEYIDLNLIDYVNSNKKNSLNNILICLHCLIVIYEIFQINKYMIGMHRDTKLLNFLLRKEKKRNKKVKIGNTEINIPIKGYVPVIIDFGRSIVLSISGKKINIKQYDRFKIAKDQLNEDCFKITEYKKYKDINIFFWGLKNLTKNVCPILSECYDELYKTHGKTNITIEEFFRYPKIKKYLL